MFFEYDEVLCEIKEAALKREKVLLKLKISYYKFQASDAPF